MLQHQRKNQNELRRVSNIQFLERIKLSSSSSFSDTAGVNIVIRAVPSDL